MEVNDQNLAYLQNLLQSGLAADNATRKAAEAALQQHETTPGFPLLVLTLISRLMTSSSASPADATMRLSAAVLFKNLVRRRWSPEEDEEQPPRGIADGEKELVKTHLVELMVSAPSDVQKQLSEAVAVVAQHDFPQRWPTLLPQLVSMLSKNDLLVSRGVLLTTHAITKRFRNVAKSDELFLVILECLRHLAAPLLSLFRHNVELINTTYAGSIRELSVLLESQRLLCRVFYSLSWQDVPEALEDSAAQWFELFAQCLSYSNALLVDNDEEQESGPVERMQAAVVENVALYAGKYEEVLEPFLARFTQLVWTLLLPLDDKPKHDLLATSAIRFLSSVASKQHSAALFAAPAVLQDVVQHIVVRNVTASELDEERFEDNAAEYVRRDMEGADSDSRRRCAAELARSLLRFFAAPVSALCAAHTTALLAQYEGQREKDWRLKDAALQLVVAAGALRGTTHSGAGELNAAWDVLPLIAQHVLPELASQKDGEGETGSEIVKADALKTLCFFRAHLPRETLLAALPLVAQFLQSRSAVLQSYAAICIDKLLTMRERERDAVTGAAPLRLSRDALRPALPALLHALLNALDAPRCADNEHVVKALMRVLSLCGEEANDALEIVLSHVLRALERVCKQPVNPHYNHCLFECVALAVRAACGTGATMTEAQRVACARFETVLFPLFQHILSQDVAEFVPYVFQILAQLLNARPPSSGLTDAYRALFAPLLSPALWERRGNVPALVDLYKAYISRGMREIVAGNNLTGVLGVFQKLLSAKATEAYAFQLLHTIYAFSSAADLQPFVPTIFNLLLHRLQDSVKHSKRVPYAKLLCHSLCVFAVVYGAAPLYDTLEALTPGLLAMLVTNIWAENRGEYWALSGGENEVKQALVGGAKILCESPLAASNADAARSLGESLRALAAQCPARRMESFSAEDESAEDRAFDSSYSKLSFAFVPQVDVAADVASGTEYLAAQLAVFAAARPGVLA